MSEVILLQTQPFTRLSKRINGDCAVEWSVEEVTVRKEREAHTLPAPSHSFAALHTYPPHQYIVPVSPVPFIPLQVGVLFLMNILTQCLPPFSLFVCPLLRLSTFLSLPLH